VTLTLPPGEGHNLAFQIVQAGVSAAITPTTRFSVSYALPTITGVSEFPLRTQGGEVFTIWGNQFGRPFPGNGSLFSPTGPTVTINNVPCPILASNKTWITCLTPEGQGTSLPVSIIVAGQPATASQTVSYAPPVIYSVTPFTNIPTNALATNSYGNSSAPLTMVIVGDNFGPSAGRLSLSIGELSNFYIRYIDPANQINVNQFLSGTNHTHIVCYVPQYFGVSRSLQVVVGGGSVTVQPSNTNVTISYEQPAIGSVAVTNVDGTVSAAFNADSGLSFSSTFCWSLFV